MRDYEMCCRNTFCVILACVIAFGSAANCVLASDAFQMAIVTSDTEFQVIDGKKLTLRQGSLVSLIESSDERRLVFTEQVHLLELTEVTDEVVGGWIASAKLVSLDDAVREASQVVMNAPGDGPALLSLANANLALQQPEKAMAALDLAVELKDGSLVLFLLRRAEIRRRSGQYADSISDSTLALEKSSRLVPAYLVRARALCDSGRFGEAIADCDRALAVNPNSFAALNYRAYVRVLTDDVAQALQDLKESHRLQSRLPLIAQKVNATLVASWDASRGMVEDWRAMQPFQKAARSLPGIRELMMLYGIRAEQREESEIAQLYLTNLLMAPLPPRTELRAYYYRSRAYAALRQHRLAQEDVANAIRIVDKAPASTSPSLTRQMLLSDQAYSLGAELADGGDYEKALTRFDEALRLNPNSIAAVSDRALVWLHQGRLEKARGDFDSVLDSSSIGSRMRSIALCGRASVSYRQNELGEALEDLTAAIEIRPKHLDAWGYRAIILARMGQFEKANDDCIECIALAPHSGVPYRSRAAVFLLAGKRDRSAMDYSRAIDLGLQDAATYSRRGYVRWKVGEYELAIKDFQQAIRLDSNCSPAHLGLGELRATCENAAFRNGNEAVKHAIKACELTNWKGEIALETLAMAYAESGNFDLALQHLQKAIDLDPESDIMLRGKLKISFKKHVPYRYQPTNQEPTARDERIPFDLP